MNKTAIFVSALFFLFTTAKVQAAPQRLVSLKPNITTILIDLGLKENLVGVTRFCNEVPKEAQVVADYTSIDIEAVTRLMPDLVFISPENTQEKEVRKLGEMGLKLVILKFGTVADLLASIEKIGEETATAEKARLIIGNMKADLVVVQELVAKKFMQKNRVALVVQKKPLMVATEKSFLGDLFKQAGFINAFAGNPIAYPTFDAEVLVRAPVDQIIDLLHEDSLGNKFAGHATQPLAIAGLLPHTRCVGSLLSWLANSSFTMQDDMKTKIP